MAPDLRTQSSSTDAQKRIEANINPRKKTALVAVFFLAMTEEALSES